MEWVGKLLAFGAALVIAGVGLALGMGRRRAGRRCPPADAVFRSHFLGPPLPRSPLQLIGETNLVRLGVAVISRSDPWMSRAEARRLRAVTGRMLRAIAARPDYAAAGSALPTVLTAFFGGLRDPGHVYTIVPPTGPGRRLGLIVFLHGHGGNLQLESWAWEAFPRRHGFAVVAPTFGYGNWEHPDGAAVVGRALDWARRHLPIDPGRVYLAGLSQGGAGVGRAGAAFPHEFAGLIFLSATMEPAVLEGPDFAAGWRGRPALVVQGGRDHSVTPASVDRGVAAMRAAGVRVTYHVESAEDHFLFFARPADVEALIAGWMTAPGGGTMA
jgi:poly(3-hydroxybutyrate) depolymerase